MAEKRSLSAGNLQKPIKIKIQRTLIRYKSVQNVLQVCG